MIHRLRRRVSGWCVGLVAIVLLAGCQDDLTPTRVSTRQQAILASQGNAQLITAIEETLDVAAGALETKGVADGRTRRGEHDRYGCAPVISMTLNVDRNRTDTIVYSGTIAISYGNGASCSPDSRRTGQVTDVFNIVVSTKNKLRFKSTETLTFEGFSREGVVYNGTLMIGSSYMKKASIEGKNLSIGYDDGTSSTWSGLLTVAYDDVTKKKGEVRVAGSMSGVSRQAAPFEAKIVEEIVYKPGCFGWTRKVPVDGVMSLTTNGETSTLDYGDGTCDKTYTLTVDGETTSHTFISN